jgi:hypothetical protein
MSEQYEDSVTSYELVIDTTTKEPIDKTTLLYNLTAIVIVIAVAMAMAVAASFLIINRKKSPNVKKPQALQKQMKPQFKT